MTINVVLIRLDGRTTTFQCDTWDEVERKTLGDVGSEWANESPIVKAFASAGDELREYDLAGRKFFGGVVA